MHFFLLIACTADPSPADESKGSGDDTATDTGDDTGPAWPAGEALTVTLDGQPLLQGTYNGAAVLWALDTGAESIFLDASLDDGSQEDGAGTVTIGSVTLTEQEVHAIDLSEARAYIGADVRGLAGQPLFQGRFTVLDYAASTVLFAETWPDGEPPGSSSHALLSWELQGGLPVVEVDLGVGEPVRLIADTGSGVDLITESRFAAIDDGTLPRLDGYRWVTTYGEDAAFVTRLPAIQVVDVTIAGTWAVVVPDEHHLSRLLELAHIDAEGFLGYPFFRTCTVGVDTEAFVLWPVNSTDHLDPDEWRRVGMEPTWRDDGFTVEMVYSPSDAADQGVRVGDRLVSIDGQDLSDWTLDQVKTALRGEPGTSRTLTVDRGGAATNIAVEVQDLLPALSSASAG